MNRRWVQAKYVRAGAPPLVPPCDADADLLNETGAARRRASPAATTSAAGPTAPPPPPGDDDAPACADAVECGCFAW